MFSNPSVEIGMKYKLKRLNNIPFTSVPDLHSPIGRNEEATHSFHHLLIFSCDLPMRRHYKSCGWSSSYSFDSRQPIQLQNEIRKSAALNLFDENDVMCALPYR